MFNLIRFALLAFTLGMLAAPLLGRDGMLEEYAFAMAEDAANQDTCLALTQFLHSCDKQGSGPLPLFGSAISPAENILPALWAPVPASFFSPEAFLGRRPLYLLYHNFRFYDFMA